jgi:DNA mismatch repair protein MutS
LAGLPEAVVARAEEILETLERGEQSSALTRLADELPLFSTGSRRPSAAQPSALEEALAEVLPDTLAPKDALELIYRLKALMGGEGG